MLLHKRHAQPDEQVAQVLDIQLTANRHRVFVDRHLSIGMKWAQELERQLQEADVVIPLLSEASAQSEMLAYEVETVREEAQRNNGKPRLLPVRLNFTGPLPEDLGRVLTPLPSLLWQGLQDNQRLVADVLGALQKPLIPPSALRPEELKPYEGGIPPGSPVYVARPIDEEFYDAIARRDSVVLVKGARQMGKTSVLARGLQRARELGYRTVLTDFQKFNASQLETADILYQALCGAITDELGLPVTPDVTWKPFRGPNQNFEYYMRTEVLAKLSVPLVWGLDEVDQLFNRPFASEVFGLLRSWHNARALDPDSPWSRLTLAIAHATEPHLFIADLNQSPFNVGTRLTLQDFTFTEVMHLNGLYGSPLKTEAEVARFVHVVGGQPFLVHRSLYLFAKSKLDLATLERQDERNEGLFNVHFGRLLLSLARDADLCDVVRNLLRGQPCTDQKSFYRLRSGGVLIGETMRDARLRCQMYATYLERHLL